VPELTCVENVALPLRLNGTSRKEAERAALGWMERLEVDDLKGKRPGEVSGGQGQRVAVARALVTGPKVIFADEPTGALDPETARDILGLLRQAVTDLHQTVVMVTHDPVAAAHTDRALFLSSGQVVDALAEPSADRVAEVMAGLRRVA
jgi:putative ABC transport system ATP-binding protein